MIAIVAALPRELALIVKGWQRQRAARGVFVWTSPHAIAVAAGMGAERAMLAVAAARAAGDVTELISVGLAGACDPMLRAGAMVEAHVVIDVRTGERFTCAADGDAVIASGPAIAVFVKKPGCSLRMERLRLIWKRRRWRGSRSRIPFRFAR